MNSRFNGGDKVRIDDPRDEKHGKIVNICGVDGDVYQTLEFGGWVSISWLDEVGILVKRHDGYSHQRYSDLLETTFAEIKKLSELKGGEYSGDTDRLANFRRNATALGLTQEQVWAVYAAKHWDAVMQFVKDLGEGKERNRLESLAGRCDDLIVYLLLFKAMLEERDMDMSRGD